MPEPARDPRGAGPGGRRLAERRAVSPRAVAIASGVGALALLLVAYLSYRRFLHYERRAIEHVPAGAELALRVDLEQVVLFEPVRRHLLPLVDRALLGAAPPAPPSRLARLREAGVNLGMDLREAVFARVQPGDGWSLALGGIFGSEPLLPRIEAVLRAEPGARLRAEGAMLVLEPSGVALAQAEDGVLILASDPALLARALAPGRGSEALGLRREGAAALAALASGLRPLAPARGGASSLVRASVQLELGDPLELTARLEHAAPVALETARRELDAWLGTPAATEQFAPQADWGGERALSARARFHQASPTQIDVSAAWERAELDRAARSLAAWLEARLPAAGPGAPGP